MEQTIEKEIHGNMPRYLETLMDLVRIPSISFDNFDQKFVTKSAEAVKALFEKAGYTRRRTNAGRMVVGLRLKDGQDFLE